jgi:hypothetical protein
MEIKNWSAVENVVIDVKSMLTMVPVQVVPQVVNGVIEPSVV